MSDAPAGHALPGNRWDRLDGNWPTQPPSVSVIVAHHDQPRQLQRLAAALARRRAEANPGRTSWLVGDSA